MSHLIDGYHLTADLDNDGDLVWTMTDTGREEIDDIRATHPDWSDDRIFSELAEDFLADGWEIIEPDEIGAFTDAPIISDDCDRNDGGEMMRVGRVWWDADYRVRSTVGELEKGNTVIWAAGG